MAALRVVRRTLILEQVEAEERERRYQMIENAGLEILIFDKGSLVRERVDFDGEALRCRLQNARKEVHVLLNVGEAPEVFAAVDAECFEVREPRRLFFCRFFKAIRERVAGNQILLQPGLQLCGAFFGEKVYRLYIDEERLLDAAPFAFLHSAPVLERRGDKFVCGDGGDGVVPVADAHGGEGYVDDRSVRAAFRKFNPVAHVNQAERDDLNAGDEAENGILKDQHQYRGEGA